MAVDRTVSYLGNPISGNSLIQIWGEIMTSNSPYCIFCQVNYAVIGYHNMCEECSPMTKQCNICELNYDPEDILYYTIKRKPSLHILETLQYCIYCDEEL